VDQATVHLAPKPVPDVPLDVDLATGHFAPHMPSGIPRDLDFSGRHLGTNPMDPRQVPQPPHALVCWIATHGKKIGQRRLLVTVVQLDPFYLLNRQVPDTARRDAFHLEGHSGAIKVLQLQGHRMAGLRVESCQSEEALVDDSRNG
jgi:hypothetical protein